jgi:putative protease
MSNYYEKWVIGDMVEEKIGVVEHFFSKVNVAAIKITSGELHVNDVIHILGATTDFTQKIDSMEINRNPVEKVTAGDDVGIKVKERVREHDFVYKIVEE